MRRCAPSWLPCIRGTVTPKGFNGVTERIFVRIAVINQKLLIITKKAFRTFVVRNAFLLNSFPIVIM